MPSLFFSAVRTKPRPFSGAEYRLLKTGVSRSSRFPVLRHYSSPSYTSVNSDEISHFDNLASSWWDPNGPSRILHQMNTVRQDFISKCLRKPSTKTVPPIRSLRYLDIGCGGGIFAESAARLPDTATVAGIDASHSAIKVAQEHANCDDFLASNSSMSSQSIDQFIDQLTLASHPPRLLNYFNTTIEAIPPSRTGEGLFDVVSLFEVLEHVNDPFTFLSMAAEHVKPGGLLVGSTIARHPLSWFTTKFMAEHCLGIVPVGTHDWNKYINPDQIKRWIDNHSTNWHSSRFEGVAYIPMSGWVVVPDTLSVATRAGNYLFAIQKALPCGE